MPPLDTANNLMLSYPMTYNERERERNPYTNYQLTTNMIRLRIRQLYIYIPSKLIERKRVRQCTYIITILLHITYYHLLHHYIVNNQVEEINREIEIERERERVSPMTLLIQH